MIIVSPDIINTKTDDVILFLAGGITDCPDWQAPTAALLDKHIPNTYFVNPRRKNWNMGDSDSESKKQIKWEFKYLYHSDVVLFWFPEETLCPITLLELGKELARGTKIYVGTHPNYQRRLDVIEQCALEDDQIKVYDSLEKMVAALIYDATATVVQVETLV